MPVVIARKAPIPWDRTFASDGMFDIGDIMVWIHDIPQTSGVRDGRQFMLSPDTVSCTNQRAIPLFYPFSAGDAHDVLHEAKLEKSWSVDAQELGDKGRPWQCRLAIGAAITGTRSSSFCAT